MIRLCEEKDRGQLLNYLQENPIYHTFLLADMEQYGFNHHKVHFPVCQKYSSSPGNGEGAAAYWGCCLF